MTNSRNILNVIDKALKWTVIGGLSGWLLISSIYSFVTIATIGFMLGCFLSCGIALGICLLILTGLNLYDLAISLKDRNFEWDQPKFPRKVSSLLQNPSKTTLDLTTPKTIISHTESVLNPNTESESIESRCAENTVQLTVNQKKTGS